MSANGEEETLPAGKGVLGYLRRGWRACEERLNDVNERYTFELNPEYRLKLRKRCEIVYDDDDARRAGGRWIDSSIDRCSI